MVKKKPKTQFQVPDNAGRMATVADRRFEFGEWPIQFSVSGDPADTWLVYLADECIRRSWNCSCVGQIEAKENSGSTSITQGATAGPMLAVVWQRKRPPFYRRLWHRIFG